jgi:DNA-binding LytR/AlgR family response regulator
MTYRRDLLDSRAVRQSGRNDDRPDTSPPRPAALDRPPRPLSASEPSSPDASAASTTNDVILAKVGFKHVAIRVNEILYAESARNYVRLYLENGAVLKTRVPIERLAGHLGATRFLRIHRGRLVNVSRIRSVAPLAGGRLQMTLSQGSTIIVARDRRRAVLAELGTSLERTAQVARPVPRTPIR